MTDGDHCSLPIRADRRRQKLGPCREKKKVSGHTGPHLGSVTVSSVDGKIIWDFYNNDNSGSIVGYLLSASEAAVLTATLWKQ